MAIFSALALGHCFFLASYFWASPKTKPNSFFLALLLTTLAIRILKSVLVILIPNSPELIPAFGLVGLAAIGPSLWLYTRTFKNRDYRASSQSMVHFAWAMVLVLIIPLLNDALMYLAYAVTVGHMLVYLMISSIQLRNRFTQLNKMERKWVALLIGSVSLIWLTFFFQLILESFSSYLAVTVVASGVLYGLSLWAGRRNKLFLEPRQSSSGKRNDQLNQIGQEVEFLLNEEKIYTNADLTIKGISSRLNRQEYLVSKAINFYFRKSFPELLNEYRVKHATRLIHSAVFDEMSIEGIAQECGYNSISAFYRAFKSIKGITPAKLKQIN